MQEVNQPQVFQPFGPLVYRGVIDRKYVDIFNEHIEGRKGEDATGRLAGLIDEQLAFTDLPVTVGNHIIRHAMEFAYQGGMVQEDYRLGIDAIWANVQRSGEVNPPHAHTGMFSFVLFTKNELTFEKTIDNKFEKGVEYNAGQVQPTLGHLVLSYGEENFFNWDKYFIWPEVGEIIIFPSWLRHFVYPHYEENKTRVSVAGNISVIQE
tara:strand:+ start:345 stop:968 length:624 start_codon:yes stop_codon:yes gene_type:complete